MRRRCEKGRKRVRNYRLCYLTERTPCSKQRCPSHGIYVMGGSCIHWNETHSDFEPNSRTHTPDCDNIRDNTCVDAGINKDSVHM